ncbi:MAG: MBL fold metallo-hydrolase [Dehalococcoidales bacterium]|jgi:glyoxylase-like metal-dependent hydrolase (beta-lactamase superfamily II)
MKLTEHVYYYPEKMMPDCNSYLIKDELTLLIDPGSAESLTELLADIKRDGINPEDIKLIANTHLHPDHCWANNSVKQLTGAKIVGHPLHQKYYQATIKKMGNYFGMTGLEFETDSYMENGKLDIGHLVLEVIPSPGHAPEQVCFYSPEEKFLVCGDVIFAQNTGRVDLPGGNAKDLKQSIESLSQLDIDYLLPGHMGIIAGKEKVQQNFEFIRNTVFNWL